MTILHIDSSVTGEQSVSRVLTHSIVDRLKAQASQHTIIYRDFAADPLDHFTTNTLSDSSVVDEFLAADLIVIGAPMYNFGIPSQLKSWIDRIAIAGKTFRYTESGAEGLAGDKTVIIASSRGGFYGVGTAAAAFDYQESYLRSLFEFLGVRNITFIRAEGVAMGGDARQVALKAAQQEVFKLAA